MLPQGGSKGANKTLFYIGVERTAERRLYRAKFDWVLFHLECRITVQNYMVKGGDLVKHAMDRDLIEYLLNPIDRGESCCRMVQPTFQVGIGKGGKKKQRAKFPTVLSNVSVSKIRDFIADQIRTEDFKWEEIDCAVVIKATEKKFERSFKKHEEDLQTIIAQEVNRFNNEEWDEDEEMEAMTLDQIQVLSPQMRMNRAGDGLDRGGQLLTVKLGSLELQLEGEIKRIVRKLLRGNLDAESKEIAIAVEESTEVHQIAKAMGTFRFNIHDLIAECRQTLREVDTSTPDLTMLIGMIRDILLEENKLDNQELEIRIERIFGTEVTGLYSEFLPQAFTEARKQAKAERKGKPIPASNEELLREARRVKLVKMNVAITDDQIGEIMMTTWSENSTITDKELILSVMKYLAVVEFKKLEVDEESQSKLFGFLRAIWRKTKKLFDLPEHQKKRAEPRRATPMKIKQEIEWLNTEEVITIDDDENEERSQIQEQEDTTGSRVERVKRNLLKELEEAEVQERGDSKKPEDDPPLDVDQLRGAVEQVMDNENYMIMNLNDTLSGLRDLTGMSFREHSQKVSELMAEVQTKLFHQEEQRAQEQQEVEQARLVREAADKRAVEKRAETDVLIKMSLALYEEATRPDYEFVEEAVEQLKEVSSIYRDCSERLMEECKLRLRTILTSLRRGEEGLTDPKLPTGIKMKHLKAAYKAILRGEDFLDITFTEATMRVTADFDWRRFEDQLPILKRIYDDIIEERCEELRQGSQKRDPPLPSLLSEEELERNGDPMVVPRIQLDPNVQASGSTAGVVTEEPRKPKRKRDKKTKSNEDGGGDAQRTLVEQEPGIQIDENIGDGGDGADVVASEPLPDATTIETEPTRTPSKNKEAKKKDKKRKNGGGGAQVTPAVPERKKRKAPSPPPVEPRRTRSKRDVDVFPLNIKIAEDTMREVIRRIGSTTGVTTKYMTKYLALKNQIAQQRLFPFRREITKILIRVKKELYEELGETFTDDEEPDVVKLPKPRRKEIEESWERQAHNNTVSIEEGPSGTTRGFFKKPAVQLRRYRRGERVLAEIRHYQLMRGFCCSQQGFVRYVREISKELWNDEIKQEGYFTKMWRYEALAMKAIQEAGEAYLEKMFGYCAIVADHRRTKKAKADDKGINVTEDDLKIVRAIRDEHW